MTTPHLVGALNWQYRRTDVVIVRGAGELAYGMDRAPNDHRLVMLDEFGDFAASHAGQGRLTLFLTDSSYAGLEPMLPPPLHLDRASGFVFAQF